VALFAASACRFSFGDAIFLSLGDEVATCPNFLHYARALDQFLKTGQQTLLALSIADHHIQR
jgi:hypothetical protein